MRKLNAVLPRNLEHHPGARRHPATVSGDVKVLCLQMPASAVEPLRQALRHVKNDVGPRPGHRAEKRGSAVSYPGAQGAAISLAQGGALPYYDDVESIDERRENVGRIRARVGHHYAASGVDSGIDRGCQPKIGLSDQRSPGALAGERGRQMKQERKRAGDGNR